MIAVATRPGLVGGLVVGTSFAKALSWSNNIPFVSVNHVEAHLYSPHLTSNIEFPYIGLLVSGGHTLIVICNSYTDYEIVGTTIDDACGEAFDKIAKHYNLGYPGGVAVEKTALSGDESTFNFPTSNLYKSDRQYDVSYSGIKTAVINHLEKYKKKDKYTTSDIAASFQKRAFTILLKKVEKAVKNYKIKRVVVSGGVSANKKLKEIFENGLKNCEVFFPDIKYATDNGAMIAGYGYHLYLKNGASPLDEGVMPRVVDFKISNRRG